MLLFVVAVVFLSTYYTLKDEYGIAADLAGGEGNIMMQAMVRVQESRAGRSPWSGVEQGFAGQSGDGRLHSQRRQQEQKAKA